MEDITYKYIPIERISYLKDELLRITQPGDLNDPFECRPVKLSIEEIHSLFNAFTTQQIEAINKMKISKDRRSELKNLLVRKFKSEKTKILKNESGNFRDKFDSDAYAKLNSKIGILSLSKRWDSILMWAHYTDAHKGLCIGFDSNEPFFKNFKSIASESKIFLPVIYADERTRIPIEQGK